MSNRKDTALLSVNNVYYDYKTEAGAVHALRGVSCCFNSGKIHAITGRSGSGKTTLLSLLAGLDQPLSGEIMLSGKSICSLELDAYRQKNIGMIFQSYYLIPQLTVMENVLLALEFSQVPSKYHRLTAVKSLSNVGISKEMYNKRISHLSGGEQQRVAIARAISCEPTILLADEPTGNLDTDNSKVIIDLLIRIAHEHNKCVVIVTHSTEIADMTDVRFNMSDGRISSLS